MVTPPNFARPEPGLARQVRDRFVRAVDAMVEPLGAAIDAQLDGALRGALKSAPGVVLLEDA